MRLALCLLAVGCQVVPPVRVESEAVDVITDIQDAIGASALFGVRGGITLFGTRQAQVDGADDEGAAFPDRPLTLSFRPSGPFLLTIGSGGGDTARGFDGTEAWIQDGRDVVRRQSLGGREHLVVDGWLRTFLWLTPGFERFEVTVDEERSTPGEIVLVLERTGEPIEVTMRVDRETRRPSSYSTERLGRTRGVRFDDWREEDGAWLPMSMTETVDGQPVHVDRFDRRGRGTPRSFAPPRSQPTDTTFDESAMGGTVSGSP